MWDFTGIGIKTETKMCLQTNKDQISGKMYCIISALYMDDFKILRPFVLKWIDTLLKRKKMINAPVMTQKQTREVKP